MASPLLSIICRHTLLQRYGLTMLRPPIQHSTVQSRDFGCLAPPTGSRNRAVAAPATQPTNYILHFLTTPTSVATNHAAAFCTDCRR